MQNISTLISQARAYGHEDTFSSTRRPRTREEFASPFSVFKQTLTLMGVIKWHDAFTHHDKHHIERAMGTGVVMDRKKRTPQRLPDACYDTSVV